MKKEDLPILNYGDRVLITYKNRNSNDPRMKLPEIRQDLGFFLEYRDGSLELSRHNPTLIGKSASCN